MDTCLGEDIAYHDQVIKRQLKKIQEQEENLLREYLVLSTLYRDTNMDIPLILNELTNRKKLLLDKKSRKEDKNTAFLKLLEYLNTIELKNNTESNNKRRETEKILLMLELIENELIPYKQINSI
tara:strand:+ start:3693 stop:4067 length:375 start_codon:yes stop_codon:yes gene_type:complete